MMSQSFNFKKRKVANGSSVAVISYDQEKDAPNIVAQGKGAIAQRIIELANQNNVPIQEDSTLISNLIDMDLGDNIPPQLYSVIAEIFIMLEEMEKNI